MLAIREGNSLSLELQNHIVDVESAISDSLEQEDDSECGLMFPGKELDSKVLLIYL